MKIRFTPEVALKLETATNYVHGLEFSGFGFAEVQQDELLVYDVVILDVGTGAYTEIETRKLVELANRPDADKMKVWLHRHPLGSGVPGPNNWSGTDNATIRDYPLGSPPELVQWSASVVRTPKGWVGRIDNHVKKTTAHVEVVAGVDPEFFQMMDVLLKKQEEIEKARDEIRAKERAAARKERKPQKEGTKSGVPAQPFLEQRSLWPIYPGLGGLDAADALEGLDEWDLEDLEEEEYQNWLFTYGDEQAVWQLIDDQVIDLEEVPAKILAGYIEEMRTNGFDISTIMQWKHEQLVDDGDIEGAQSLADEYPYIIQEVVYDQVVPGSNYKPKRPRQEVSV